MAEVWEGRDEVLSRPVAVKMLLAHLAADPQLRERFRREAVTAARLVHPGIVATFDAGVTPLGDSGTGAGSLLAGGWSHDETDSSGLPWPASESTAFIVMELVPGETLRDLIARACPVPPELAVPLIAQVADALAYAHAQGLVHRDIKPANVLLRDEGGGMARVKVTDFGIAKATEAAGADLTATGTVLGTPKYLAPEQVQGREPDARADLYSVGVVLFEMLAGGPPFKGTTDMATALAHVQQPPPHLDDLRPGLPPGLSGLVDALLVKDPEKRVPSALVLGGALMNISKTLGVPAQSQPGAYLQLGPVVMRATGPSGAGNDGQGTWGKSVGAAQATIAEQDEWQEAPAGVGGVGQGQGLAYSGGTVALPEDGSPEAPSRGRRRRDQKRASRRQKPSVRRRPGVITTTVVGVLVVAGALAGLELWRTSSPTKHHESNQGQTSSSQRTEALVNSSTTVKILSVTELTQRGDLPNDNLALLPNLIDGNLATSWRGAVYDGPNFGGYDGFGLVMNLGSPHILHDLVVTSSMQGWSAQTFTSDTSAPTIGGWGTATASHAGVYGSATFSLGGRKASYVLLWMTNPGPTDQAEIAELTIH